jgi:Na+/phosphate symporter
MTANSIIIAIAILLALCFWLMDQLKFLIPYRSVIIHQYGAVILAWLGVLFVNIFSAAYAIQRKFFLKDTGRKLSHLDKQLVSGCAPVPPPTQDEE